MFVLQLRTMSKTYDNTEFVEMYDELYSDKQYSSEVEFILKSYDLIHFRKPSSILDVGSGTGTHSLLLSRQNIPVVGIDISEKMINVALKKRENLNLDCEFFTNRDFDSRQEIQLKKFDLVISMFNVINHIHLLSELQTFFSKISDYLYEDGVLIFDMWNPVAVAQDLPKDRKIEKVFSSGEKVTVTTCCNVDLMNSKVWVKSLLERKNQTLRSVLDHSLWSPRVIKEILSSLGFEVFNLCKSHDIKSPAKSEDYKICFTCKKTKMK